MRDFYHIYKKWLWLGISILFFVGIFVSSIKPNDNSDTFYHVKAGEIFVKQGILHKDIFSFTAQGRRWYPYEWFFEIIVYEFQHLLGYNSLRFFVAGVTTIEIALLFIYIKKLFNLHTFLTIILCSIFFMWNYELFVARPQLFVLPIFTLSIFSIFFYLKKNKNFLWITIPFSWMLANMHGSIIYSIYLFLSYTCVCFLLFLIKKDKLWFKKAKILGIYTLLTALVSILPPIGFTQYALLFLFSQHISLIQKFISEWAPLSQLSSFDKFYYFSAFIGAIPILWISLKKKDSTTLFLLVPLVTFLFFPFIAFRNTITAYIVFIIFWSWSLASINFQNLKKWMKVLFISILIGFIIFYANVFYHSKTNTGNSVLLPDVTNFLLQHHINGNMFNSFNQGSYLIYRLYPKYKLFIDLRVDVYICCELPKYEDTIFNTALYTIKSDDSITKSIFNPYHISFTVLNNSGSSGILASKLESDPSWALVYWDDSGNIFVKKDGKNDTILKQFGTIAATPFGTNPVESNNFSQALKEYQHMITITDSAKSRNALGYIYLKQKNYTQAKNEFEKAISLDPTFDSPYGNLAELSLYYGDSKNAISLYNKAQEENPFRAYTYLRLAQLYFQYENDSQKAQQVLEEGLQNAQNNQDKQTLQNVLSQLENPLNP